MPTRIDEYREAKNTYFKLRNQAKKELIARFNELAQELLQLQRELLEDFGEKIAIPAKPQKSRPGAKPAKTAATSPVGAASSAATIAPSPKVLQIQKQIQQQKKKLADAQGAGKPTKAIDDRIYELEDELRLAQGK